MALQIIKPYVHVEDANGNPYVGAQLYVYLVTTTTKASIYSDDGLSISLTNPLTSDAAGNFPRAYIAAGTYKLRAETSAGVLIWQEDNIDTGLSAGSGALPIARGGTGATTAAAARAALDVPSNSELTALSSTISTLQTTIQGLISAPQGRLTLTSGTPVLTTGISAGTAVYYSPYLGNIIPIYDGSQFNATSFTEQTLTLSANHVASSHYDVFIFKNSGTVTIGTGPAWNTVTAGAGARGAGAGTTELTRTIGGLMTNANSMTARNGATTYTVAANQGTYLGSLFIDGSAGQISCLLSYGQSRKWGVWNAYNRVPVIMKAGDSTVSWGNSSATTRASNGSTANVNTVFSGLAEEMHFHSFKQLVLTNGAGRSAQISIGVNSFTASSGIGTLVTDSAGSIETLAIAEYIQSPFIGINNIDCQEASPGASVVTFFGLEGSMVLSSQFRA